MEQVLATINLNIGLGKDNPSLVIRNGDKIETLVSQLISDYQLPAKVYGIIMERVKEELPLASSPKTIERTPKTPLHDKKKKSVSPIRAPTSTAKIVVRKPVARQK
jgi:hypothetical protein